jgi:hypothetical protein
MKTTSTLLALTTLYLTTLVAANPPACLLSAVNTHDDPSSLSALCGDDATDIQAEIDELCNSDTKSLAQEAFISTCSAAGSSVAAYTPTSSSSSSSASRTGGSGSAGATAAAGSSTEGEANETASGGGSVATGDSGAAELRVMGGLMAAAAAVAGLAVGL